MEEGADSVKLYDQNNTLSERHIKADKNADERVPDQTVTMDYEYLLAIDFHG